VNYPYYHTVKDTPDKVDTTFLAQVVDQLDGTVGRLLADPPQGFRGLDDKLWRAAVIDRPHSPGTALTVDVTVTSADGTPQAAAKVDGVILTDDFFPAAAVHGTTDAMGKATLVFPAGLFEQGGSGNRYLHVTAGPTYPLVEQVLLLH
jgi:hypothetical protein